MRTAVQSMTAWEGATIVRMARIVDEEDDPIVQADVSSIAYKVYSLASSGGSTAATQTSTGSLTKTEVIYDTLQTTRGWQVDRTGYNFRWVIPGSLRPTGGVVYLFEVVFTMGNGVVIADVFKSSAANLHGS